MGYLIGDVAITNIYCRLFSIVLFPSVSGLRAQKSADLLKAVRQTCVGIVDYLTTFYKLYLW